MDATLTALPIDEPDHPAVTAAAAVEGRRHKTAVRPKRKTAREPKPRCEDCFFFQNDLCALEDKKPCPTFRRAHPDGLRPPQQLSFAFRLGRPAAEVRLDDLP